MDLDHEREAIAQLAEAEARALEDEAVEDVPSPKLVAATRAMWRERADELRRFAAIVRARACT